MKTSIKMACTIVLLLCSNAIAGDMYYQHLPNFEVPDSFFTDHHFHPIGYISSYPVANTNVILQDKKRQKLVLLLIKAEEACRAKYSQSYFLETEKPIYLLIANNFPEVKKFEAEGGHLIYMSDLVKVVHKK